MGVRQLGSTQKPPQRPPDDTMRDLSPYAPIPGTERPERGLFIDRWGTLLTIPERGWCARFSPDLIAPGAVEAMFRAQQSGWTLYLIGNEDAVANGRVSDAAWQRFEAALIDHLDGLGIRIRRNYACLDDPEGQGKHKRSSVFQFPNTGVLYHASQNDGIVLEKSWVIGDSSLEISAGDRSGCRTAGVRTGNGVDDGELHVEPEFIADDLSEVLESVLAGDAYARP